MEPSGGGESARWHARGGRGPSTTADPAGLIVRRGVRKRTIAWPDVASIAQERRTGYLAGWTAVVRLKDGSTLTDLPGITTPDGTYSNETAAALDTLTDHWRRALTPEPAVAGPTPAVSGPTPAVRSHLHHFPSQIPVSRKAVRRRHTALAAVIIPVLWVIVFACSSTIDHLSRDSAILGDFQSPKSCTAVAVETAPAHTWCRVTGLVAADDPNEPGWAVEFVPAEPTTSPDYVGRPTFFAYFDEGQSVPADLKSAKSVTVVVEARSTDIASATFGSHRYLSPDSPPLQVTADRESAITGVAFLAFLLAWTIRGFSRRRGLVALSFFVGTLAATAVAAGFYSTLKTQFALSTSATVEVWVTALVALAAGAGTSLIARHRLRHPSPWPGLWPGLRLRLRLRPGPSSSPPGTPRRSARPSS